MQIYFYGCVKYVWIVIDLFVGFEVFMVKNKSYGIINLVIIFHEFYDVFVVAAFDC